MSPQDQDLDPVSARDEEIAELARQLEQAERRIEWLQERGVEELRGDVKLAREQRDIYARQWGQAEREKERYREGLAVIANLPQRLHPIAGYMYDQSPAKIAAGYLTQNTKPSGEVGEEAPTAFFSGHLQEARMLRDDETVEDVFDAPASPPKEGS